MDFPRGKVVAVMGGSGSGKTTILRLIGGQLQPNTGHVSIGGELVDAKLIREGRYDLIEEKTRQYLAAIAKARAEMAS